MNEETIAKISEHYEHAKEKHPHFCDMSVPCLTKVGAVDRLRDLRGVLKYCIENKCVAPTDILDCELAEVLEAYHRGDIAQAIEEIHDCIAVLLRWKDVLEGRQALGKPEGGAE